jgi:hypothetical protein
MAGNLTFKSANEVKMILKTTWPHLTQIWPFDQKYPCLKRDEYIYYIDRAWEKQLGDCDDRALFLHSDVKKEFYKDYPEQNSLAFGEVFGDLFNAWPALHNQNIAVCDEDTILMIEPQTKDYWNAHAADDRPYWVRF